MVADGEAASLAQAVAMSTGDLGPHHPRTIELRYDMALKYEAAGRLVDAVATLQKVANGATRTLGPRDTLTLDIRVALARCLSSVGRFDDAAGVEELLVRDLVRVNGEHDPSVAAARRPRRRDAGEGRRCSRSWPVGGGTAGPRSAG